MSNRNPARICSKCAGEHPPPLIDELCVRARPAGVGIPVDDNVEKMSSNEQLQSMIATMAESVQAVSARVGSLESTIAEYFKKKGSKKDKRKKKKKKEKKDPGSSCPSSSATSSSSESSSEFDNAGEGAVSSAESGASADDRGRARSKTKKSKKHRSSAVSLLRKSSFTHKPFIQRGKPVVNFERLMVCSLLMMKDVKHGGGTDTLDRPGREGSHRLL